MRDVPVAWVIYMNTIPWGNGPWSRADPRQEEEEQGNAEGSALELPSKARLGGLGLTNINASEQ